MSRAEKIGVGLSGGVDSAAAAWLLLQAGHEVAAYVMRLPVFDGAANGDAGAENVLADARRVAGHLGVPLEELDLREEFERRT